MKDEKKGLRESKRRRKRRKKNQKWRNDKEEV
jgi:hypothetical protein